MIANDAIIQLKRNNVGVRNKRSTSGLLKCEIPYQSTSYKKHDKGKTNPNDKTID